MESTLVTKPKQTWQQKLFANCIEVLKNLLVLFFAVLLANMFRFFISAKEGFASGDDTISYMFNTFSHLSDVEHAHVVLVALLIAAALRGIAHGTKFMAVSSIIENLRRGKEVHLFERFTLRTLYFLSRVVTVISILVLSPVIDPSNETSLQTIVETLQPFADDLISADLLTLLVFVLICGGVALLWRIVTDPVKIPQAVQKELKKRKITLTTMEPVNA